MEGLGTLKFVDGTVYVGNFKNDLPNGMGTLKMPYNDSFTAIYSEGKLINRYN